MKMSERLRRAEVAVRRALKVLHTQDVGAIYRMMVDADAKGVCGDPTGCAIANYLRYVTRRTQFISINVCLGERLVKLSYASKRGPVVRELPMDRTLVRFGDNFDAGKYPDLISLRF